MCRFAQFFFFKFGIVEIYEVSCLCDSIAETWYIVKQSITDIILSRLCDSITQTLFSPNWYGTCIFICIFLLILHLKTFLLQIARKAILTLMFSNDKQFVYRNCTNIFTVEAISNCAENCRSKSANDVWWEKHKLIHQNPRNQFKKKLTIFC